MSEKKVLVSKVFVEAVLKLAEHLKESGYTDEEDGEMFITKYLEVIDKSIDNEEVEKELKPRRRKERGGEVTQSANDPVESDIQPNLRCCLHKDVKIADLEKRAGWLEWGLRDIVRTIENAKNGNYETGRILYLCKKALAQRKGRGRVSQSRVDDAIEHYEKILETKDAKIEELEKRVGELDASLNGALRIIAIQETILKSKKAGGEGD